MSRSSLKPSSLSSLKNKNILTTVPIISNSILDFFKSFTENNTNGTNGTNGTKIIKKEEVSHEILCEGIGKKRICKCKHNGKEINCKKDNFFSMYK